MWRREEDDILDTLKLESVVEMETLRIDQNIDFRLAEGQTGARYLGLLRVLANIGADAVILSRFLLQ
jgi:hypothetical protein